MKILLASGADVNERGPDGWTALMYAGVAGNLEMAVALLEAGANVNLPAADGWTPLMKACLWDRTELVAMLLENGADMHPKTPDGWTAWTIALNKGSREVIQQLRNWEKRTE